jgi:TetR/AcrR family transcriptional repressor of nem operon
MARPREFDEEEVLMIAIDAFWTNGYEATSTRELVRLTGLGQPSLYNVFGDKRSLFRRALRTYAEWTVRDRIAYLQAEFSPGRALAAYFDDVIESAITDPLQRGCLLINTVLCASINDDDLKRSVAEDIEEIRRFFERCVTYGQQSGELTVWVSPQAAADHLFAILLGIRVQAKINPDAASLKTVVATAFATLGLDSVLSVGA